MQIVLLETFIDAGGLDSVVEEEVLLNVSDVPTAFGVLYTRLPQTVFEAVQKVCLGLTVRISAQIQSLKTKLF